MRKEEVACNREAKTVAGGAPEGTHEGEKVQTRTGVDNGKHRDKGT